jgi:hypothetical protein
MLKTRFGRFSVLLVVVIAFLAVVWARAGTVRTPASSNSWTESPASQLIFFAVLEGLYRDGVSNEDVDLIIPPGKSGKGNFDREHFVYACPLCHPAFEAFRLYRQREDFYGFKGRVTTFGSGLDATLTAGLHSPDAGQRRQAIEGLINRWVTARLEMMRLSNEERESITHEMQKGRKQGMSGLKTSTQVGTLTRTNCPICDASFGACKIPVR